MGTSRLTLSFAFEEARTGPVRPAIATVCSYPLSARQVTPSRCLTTWALEYHVRPAGLVFFGARRGAPLPREAGTVHLYAPGCIYGEDARDADALAQETYWLFAGGDAAGLNRFVDNPRRFARFFDPENLIGAIMLESARICGTRGQDAFWLVQGLLATALFYLTGSRALGGDDHALSASPPRPRFGEQVEFQLRRHLAAPLTLATLARLLLTSPSRLSHAFKAETGGSPMARLRALRIEHAQRLLLKGETLKSIAAVTGHSSEYHLSRNFKQITGVSPRQFRRRGLFTASAPSGSSSSA